MRVRWRAEPERSPLPPPAGGEGCAWSRRATSGCSGVEIDRFIVRPEAMAGLVTPLHPRLAFPLAVRSEPLLPPSPPLLAAFAASASASARLSFSSSKTESRPTGIDLPRKGEGES